MINWQLTATTVLCKTTGAEITIMVSKDGGLRCTGQTSLSGKGRKPCSCEAQTCPQVNAYRDRLMSEECNG